MLHGLWISTVDFHCSSPPHYCSPSSELALLPSHNNAEAAQQWLEANLLTVPFVCFTAFIQRWFILPQTELDHSVLQTYITLSRVIKIIITDFVNSFLAHFWLLWEQWIISHLPLRSCAVWKSQTAPSNMLLYWAMFLWITAQVQCWPKDSLIHSISRRTDAAGRHHGCEVEWIKMLNLFLDGGVAVRQVKLRTNTVSFALLFTCFLRFDVRKGQQILALQFCDFCDSLWFHFALQGVKQLNRSMTCTTWPRFQKCNYDLWRSACSIKLLNKDSLGKN